MYTKNSVIIYYNFMKNSELLTGLGLNKYESKIYLTLLELGSAQVSDISQQTGLHRPIVYKFLPGLLEKNLIAESWKGKRKVYIAESPSQLKKMFGDFSQSFDSALPELMRAYSQSNSRPVIKFFTGRKGIVHVYEDILATCKKGDILYRYESPKHYRAHKTYVPKEYIDRFRDKMEVERFIITNEMTRKIKAERLGRIVKVVPAKYDLFLYDITQIIYVDKIAFIDYNTETALIIESALIAQFQKQLFKLLWSKI